MKIERQLQGTLNTVFTELIKEKGLEKKILDAYWKEKFGKLFNKKEIANESQLKMF